MTSDIAADLPVRAEPLIAVDDDAVLIDWLRERDAPCPLCQYNLRGLTVPRCPECGHALRLSVSIVDPDVKPWVTVAVAVCGSAGMGVFFACIVLREGMPHEGKLLDWTLVLFMLTIPTPLVLLRTRRRYQRLPRATQWVIAGSVVLVALAALAVLCAGLK